MEITRIPLFRCDQCGKEDYWEPGWTAWDVLLGWGTTKWEYEFHVCGDACFKKLSAKPKKELTELAQKILRKEV